MDNLKLIEQLGEAVETVSQLNIRIAQQDAEIDRLLDAKGLLPEQKAIAKARIDGLIARRQDMTKQEFEAEVTKAWQF